MKLLEDEIDELEELDTYRRKAADLRHRGQQALVKLFPPVQSGFDLKNLGSAKVLAGATVLKALLVHRRGRVKRLGQKDADLIKKLTEFLTDELERTPPDIVFARRRPDKLPILRAARAMSTLVTAPDSALSRSVFGFYYVVIREMFTGDAPDWMIGGARAGDASAPTAFVTAECTRAIAGLHKALSNTASYIERIAAMLKWRSRSKDVVPEEWLKVDKERAALEFLTTAEVRKGNIALKLEPLRDVGNLDAFLDFSPEDIRESIDLAVNAFVDSEGDAQSYRGKETAKKDNPALSQKERDDIEKRLVFSETAHKMAANALRDAVAQGEEAKKVFTGRYNSEHERLDALAKLFNKAAKETKKMLHSAKEFLSRVLDRQLAAAVAKSAWDAGEMAFAAVAFGYVAERWDDERLAHAARHLIDVLSPRGRFPIGKAIFTNENGFAIHVLNAEVLRAFAQLLQHVTSVEISPDLARRMLIFLEDTQVIDNPGTWHNDDVRTARTPQPWVSATAIYALDRINRMLDARINERVFKFFTVRKPEDLEEVPELPHLFYPDYGLASSLANHEVKAPKPRMPRESVALVLERMRAHVLGVADDERWGDISWSLILYGPPGTGKSTLVESLAKTCSVPLVDVTPSDIVVGGVDKVERRARAVFKALSLLTRAVIMFDEFEPVLKTRPEDDPNPNAFSFVTPGMLPKLKTLHDTAEWRGVAYVLNTNLLRKLDSAAIREGRFDRRSGIYPPDVLSRIGRLFSEIADFEQQMTPARHHLPDRAWKVIHSTVCGPMNTLGKRGWFTKPKQLGTGKRNAYEYIFQETSEYTAPTVEADLKRHGGGREAANEEFYDWSFALAWDDAIAEANRKDRLEDVKRIAKLAPTEEAVTAFIEKKIPPSD